MTSKELIDLTVAILATYRLSLMLTCEDGPYDILLKIRTMAGVYRVDEYGRPIKMMGRLLDCLWCTSVWVGIAVWVSILLTDLSWYVLIPLALSAGAVAIDGVCRHGEG